MSGDASRPEDCAIRISAALSVDVTHAATPQILAALISFAAAEDAAARAARTASATITNFRMIPPGSTVFLHRSVRARSHTITTVLDPKVFKAYDVRGIYPEELDEAGAHAIGRAYVQEFEPRRMGVGRDMRLSAPAMADAVMRGAAEAGADVLDLGMVGTEMLYFAVGQLGLDGGIAVTASHNPKEYTGMKIVRRGALPVGGDSGLLDIRTRALSPGDRSKGRSPGHARKEDIWPRWVDAVLSFVDAENVEPLRVVIDAADGMAGVMSPP